MATSRLCTDDEKKGGKVNCKTPEGGNEGTKKAKGGKESKLKYLKTVKYTEKENKPSQTKVVEKSRLVVSDAMKEQDKPETKGITFEGQTSQKTTDSGNKEAGKGDMSRVKETRYFKRRTKLGQALTGEAYKQKGAAIESQTKQGEKEVITYKGKGRAGRKFTEKGDVIEREKVTYDKAKSEADKKKDILGNLPFGEQDKLNTLNYVAKKTKGTDTDYELGNKGDKQWNVGKDSYKSDVMAMRKKNKKSDVKVKRAALSKIKTNG